MPKIEPFVVPGPQSQWRFNADFLTLLEDVKLYAPLSLYYVWDRHLGDLFADPDVEAIERMLHALQHHLAKTRRIGDWERIFLGMTLLMLEAPYIQTASPNKTKVVQLIIDPARKQLEIEGVDTPRVWGALLDAAFGVLSRTRPGQSAFYAIARAMFRYGPDPQVEDVKHTLATLAPDSYPKQAEAKGDHPFRRSWSRGPLGVILPEDENQSPPVSDGHSEIARSSWWHALSILVPLASSPRGGDRGDLCGIGATPPGPTGDGIDSEVRERVGHSARGGHEG